jgi:UDP-GlcNAc:undecaprenyl-phosphate GlcNAc-1-phosphate transferase
MPAAIACLVSLLLMPLAVRLGVTTGMVDRPAGKGRLAIHDRPVSVLGGPAAIAAVFVSLVITGSFPVAAVFGVGPAVAIGLLDDARPLPPWLRVVVLALAGAVTGQALGGDAGSIAIGALLGLACSNAVNLVDGQDALAGGLSILISLSMAMASFSLEGHLSVPIGLASAGALAGFLVWNRPPARLFLGNGGAYGVGMLLAIQALELLSLGLNGAVAAGICLAYLAFEVLVTVVRRARSHAGVLSGDRDHSYDLLAARLHGRSRATVALLFLQAVLGLIGIAAAVAPPALSIAIAAAVFVVGVTAVVVVSGGTSAHRRPRLGPVHHPTERELP